MSHEVGANEALERLRLGNQRFVDGAVDTARVFGKPNDQDIDSSQHPFAIVVGCSDSRVPPAMIFDQGLGDLFIIRVAGHVIERSQIDSVEFAAVTFGTRLVVVLGHSDCGAIRATIDRIIGMSDGAEGQFRSIVDNVRPAIEGLIPDKDAEVTDELVANSVRANIHACVKQLKESSQDIQHMISDDGLRIVGAEYSLENGEVEFYL